jgi:hypothetical protein
MQNASLKAPEGHNIGNKKSTPSVFSAPEGRNIGKKTKSPIGGHQYYAPLGLKILGDCE